MLSRMVMRVRMRRPRSRLTLSNAYIGVTDVTIGTSEPVPEASTLAMLPAGFLGIWWAGSSASRKGMRGLSRPEDDGARRNDQRAADEAALLAYSSVVLRGLLERDETFEFLGTRATRTRSGSTRRRLRQSPKSPVISPSIRTGWRFDRMKAARDSPLVLVVRRE